MSVSGKGEQIAGKSKEKRPMLSPEVKADGVHCRRKLRSGVLKLSGTDAAVTDSHSDPKKGGLSDGARKTHAEKSSRGTSDLPSHGRMPMNLNDDGGTSRKGRKRAKRHEMAAHVIAASQERNDPLRIFPSVEANAEDDNQHGQPIKPSAETDDSKGQHIEPNATPNPDNKGMKVRGKAKLMNLRKKWKNKGPIPVKFNERGQYVGPNAALFSSFIGCTARELIPMTAPEWKNLSDEFKNDIWKHVKETFIVDDIHRKAIFQKMRKFWRDNILTVIKHVEERAKVVGLECAAALFKPDDIESTDQWLTFVKKRTSVEYKEKCKKFKKMRDEKTLLHRTSRKGFARLEEELREKSENPETISRSDVWVHGYEAKPKNGLNEVAEDPEIVKQVKQVKEQQGPLQQCTLNDDAVASVLGPDPRGRVRGLGFGATPSKAGYHTVVGKKYVQLESALSVQAQNMLSQSQQIDRQSQKIDQQSVQIDQLQQMVTSLSAQVQGNNHRRNRSVQQSDTKFTQEKENTRVQHCRKGATQSRQRNRNTARPRHLDGDEPQSKYKRVTRSRGNKDGQIRCELLSWFSTDELVVARAKVESKDPSAMVHHVPLGHGCWKVCVVDVSEDIPLFRPTREFLSLSSATGSTIAWPEQYIKLI